jgi:hypothetical protein
MALYTRKTALFAKIESVSGTPETLVAANTLVIRNVTLTPLDATMVDRSLMRNYMGNSPQIAVDQKVSLDFEIEIAGAGGAANAIPKFGPLLLACGMVGADLTTSYAYTVINSGFQTLSLETFIDGVKHAMYGAMGDVTWDFTVKQIPVMKFKFLGRYTTPSDASAYTYTPTGWTAPLGVNNTNTPTFSLHTIAQSSAAVQALSISLGNQLDFESLIGNEFVQIVDRKASGSVTLLAHAVATKNWFTTALAMTQDALNFVHGTATGNKVQVAAPNAQILKPTYGDMNGLRTLQMGLQFIPTSSTVGELTFSTL